MASHFRKQRSQKREIFEATRVDCNDSRGSPFSVPRPILIMFSGGGKNFLYVFMWSRENTRTVSRLFKDLYRTNRLKKQH